jgi:hypothetical protein
MLAEEALQKRTWRWYLLRGSLGAAAIAFVVLGWQWFGGFGHDKGKSARQVARIAILPDRPPPPPPPPREDKPPPKEDKPKPADAPKQADAAKPANEPLKMEGAAGDGPSPFAAGTVRNEAGTAAVAAASAPAPAPNVADRARERLYASSARQMLRDSIERHLRSDAEQASADFTLWLEADGAIRRIELAPTGDARLDGELDAALGETRRSLRLPPPPAALAPMRFRLTLRPQGG